MLNFIRPAKANVLIMLINTQRVGVNSSQFAAFAYFATFRSITFIPHCYPVPFDVPSTKIYTSRPYQIILSSILYTRTAAHKLTVYRPDHPFHHLPIPRSPFRLCIYQKFPRAKAEALTIHEIARASTL